MRKILFIITTLLLLIISLPTSTYAETKENQKGQVGVHDLANVLSNTEKKELYEMGTEYANKYGLDIVFLTASNTHGKSSMVYSDDFYDGLEGGVAYGENGILVFVDLDNGYDYVNTIGSAISNISDGEIERILDEAFEIPEENYYGRLKVMMEESIKAYDTKKPIVTLGSLSIGAILSGIVVCILYVKHNSANEKTNAAFYMDSTQSSFKKIDERLVRTYDDISRGYYKESSSSSGSRSSGGSSHRSSSGRSHGGGGRKR